MASKKKKLSTDRAERNIGAIITNKPEMVGQVSTFSLAKVQRNKNVATPAKMTIKTEFEKRSAAGDIEARLPSVKGQRYTGAAVRSKAKTRVR